MTDISKCVQGYVGRKIDALLKNGESSAVKASLARLRRGIGRKPGDDPELWGMLLQGIPEELMSDNSEPSRAEWAVYTALTLFALHQQGNSMITSPMSREGQTLGKAIRGLVPPGDADAEERILRRFNQAVTGETMAEVSYFLRGIVQLLHAEGIALDYPALARDLYWFQFPEAVAGVRLRWGQDFYRITEKTVTEQ